MAEHNANQDSPISDSLHPLVNTAIIGLVLMFVAAVWMFFDSGPYEAWLDVVVTGLFVIAIAIPAAAVARRPTGKTTSRFDASAVVR